jgi:hypothetical protein
VQSLVDACLLVFCLSTPLVFAQKLQLFLKIRNHGIFEVKSETGAFTLPFFEGLMKNQKKKFFSSSLRTLASDNYDDVGGQNVGYAHYFYMKTLDEVQKQKRNRMLKRIIHPENILEACSDSTAKSTG